MAPTIQPGEYISVDMSAYKRASPQRWDVIVFKYPGEAQTNFIKRMVGLPNETLRLLFALARESGLASRIKAMFGGEKINITENRAVLHVALRAPRNATILLDGKNVVPDVHAVLD